MAFDLAKGEAAAMTDSGFSALPPGPARERTQDDCWAISLFTWAGRELAKKLDAAEARPLNRGLQRSALEVAEAITEKLFEWEPSNGPH